MLDLSDAVWFKVRSGTVLPSFGGRALPTTADSRTRYSGDLMCGLASGISSGMLDFRKRNKLPDDWWSVVEVLGVSMAIPVISNWSSQSRLVDDEVGDYYRRRVASFVPDAAKSIALLTDVPGQDFGALCARTSRLTCESAEKAGVKLKYSLNQITFAYVPATIRGGQAYLSSLLASSFRTSLDDAIAATRSEWL